MPDDRSNNQDPGQVEVVSEQKLDGSFEIKVQTRETPAIDEPQRAVTDERQAVTEGGGATALGFGLVIILLVVGSWFLFVSPRTGDEDKPLVAPSGAPQQTQLPSNPLPQGSNTPVMINTTAPTQTVDRLRLNPSSASPDTGVDAGSAAAPEEEPNIAPPEGPAVPDNRGGTEENESAGTSPPSGNQRPIRNTAISPPNRMVDTNHRIGPQHMIHQVAPRGDDRPEEAYDELDDDEYEDDEEYEYDEEYDDEEYDDEEYDDEEYDDEEYDDEEYDEYE